MVKRAKPEAPKSATLSPEQMKTAIPKLQRRIAELEAVDVGTIQERGDPECTALKKKIDSTLADIFGNDTAEYNRFRVSMLCQASIILGRKTPLHEIREGYRQGIKQAILNLRTLIDLFQENISGLGESSTGKALKALGELELHPEIERAIGKLFRDGHYANAVEDACKVLDGLVRIRSGKYNLSGTELMQTVFSPKKPVLKFNELLSQTDMSEQQGMMFLYAGAMLAFRNPRAHQLIVDDPEKALEYIAFLSLLAKSLDQVERIDDVNE